MMKSKYTAVYTKQYSAVHGAKRREIGLDHPANHTGLSKVIVLSEASNESVSGVNYKKVIRDLKCKF